MNSNMDFDWGFYLHDFNDADFFFVGFWMDLVLIAVSGLLHSAVCFLLYLLVIQDCGNLFKMYQKISKNTKTYQSYLIGIEKRHHSVEN